MLAGDPRVALEQGLHTVRLPRQGFKTALEETVGENVGTTAAATWHSPGPSSLLVSQRAAFFPGRGVFRLKGLPDDVRVHAMPDSLRDAEHYCFQESIDALGRDKLLLVSLSGSPSKKKQRPPLKAFAAHGRPVSVYAVPKIVNCVGLAEQQHTEISCWNVNLLWATSWAVILKEVVGIYFPVARVGPFCVRCV